MFSLTILRKFSPDPMGLLLQDGSITVGLPSDSSAFPKTSCGFDQLLNPASNPDPNWSSVNAVVVDNLGYIYTTASTVAQVITASQA